MQYHNSVQFISALHRLAKSTLQSQQRQIGLATKTKESRIMPFSVGHLFLCQASCNMHVELVVVDPILIFRCDRKEGQLAQKQHDTTRLYLEI